jgi:hypothetical protein
MLAAAEEKVEAPAEEEVAAEGESPVEEMETPGKKKEVAELLVSSVESLAGDAQTVSVLADELANEKVERIRTKRVRDDKV